MLFWSCRVAKPIFCYFYESVEQKLVICWKFVAKSTFSQLTKVFHKRFGEFFWIIPVIFFCSKYDTIYTTWASSLLSKRYSKCVACISRIHLFNVNCSNLIKLFHQFCVYSKDDSQNSFAMYALMQCILENVCIARMMYGNVLCMKLFKHDLLSYWYKWILSAADGSRIAGREWNRVVLNRTDKQR